MACDVMDFAGVKDLVNLEFPAKAIISIEELDCCESIRTLYKTILTRPGSEKPEQSAAMPLFVLVNARIGHATFFHLRNPGPIEAVAAVA
jgi:hypothetical protein